MFSHYHWWTREQTKRREWEGSKSLTLLCQPCSQTRPHHWCPAAAAVSGTPVAVETQPQSSLHPMCGSYSRGDGLGRGCLFNERGDKQKTVKDRESWFSLSPWAYIAGMQSPSYQYRNLQNKANGLYLTLKFALKTLKVHSRFAQYSPGWCGSGDWALGWEPKSCGFNFGSGHMLGLWVRSLFGGVQELTTHWCFSPSLSLSLTFSLKVNKMLQNGLCSPLYVF